MLPVIVQFDAVPPATKNNGAFTNSSSPFDSYSTMLGVADYMFATFSTSAMDVDFTTLQLEFSPDGTNWYVGYDFASQLIAHTTSQVQRYTVGISVSGQKLDTSSAYHGARYWRWNAVAGNGSTGITGYGQITAVQIGIQPASSNEMSAGLNTNFVYAEIL